MSKKKEIEPKLRFLKYKSKWIIDNFNFEFLQTNSFSRAEMDAKEGSVKNIHYGDILTKYNDILRDISVVPFVNKDMDLSKFQAESYLKNGDIVIADTAEDLTAGKAVEVMNIDFPVLAGQHTFLCRPKNNFAPGFMGYYFNSPSYHNRLIPLLTGTKVYSISKANIKNTFILYPERYEEQQKIADCLSSVDELIDAESRKLEALKKYKKGLMQKLFPAERETLPEWRFPEFRGKSEWRIKSLGKICTNYDSRRIPITEKDRVKGEIPYIGASGVIDYINDFIFDEDLLCVSEDGANLVARTYPIAFSISGKTWVNNHAHVLKFSHRYTQNIVESYLNMINLQDFLTGMAQPKLNRAKLDIIPIPLPEEEEQQKIADCLSEIDTMITKQSNKLDQLKAHKKGLMQGLFPSIEEADV